MRGQAQSPVVRRQGVRTGNMRKLIGIELLDDNCSEPVKVAQPLAVLGGAFEEIMPKKYELVS